MTISLRWHSGHGDTVRLPLADDVEGAPGDEPSELVSTERLGTAELEVTAVGPGDATRNRGIRGERRQVEDGDSVVLADLLVCRRVGEGEGEQALLLQVRLVDPCEGAGQDREPTAVSRLHGGVFAEEPSP